MTLNEAIYKVISTQFKKDMGGALTIVEQAGYKVTKWDRRFYVKNEKTDREVCLREGYKGYTVVGNGYDKHRIPWDGVCRMDLVGYLEKPLNRDWYSIQAKRADWRSPTFYKWIRLKDARYAVSSRTKEIAVIKKQIARLQEDLEATVVDKIKSEQELVAVRKDLGLIK